MHEPSAALESEDNGVAEAIEPEETSVPEAMEPEENGVAEAIEPDENGVAEAMEPEDNDDNGVPDPLEHATPDVELADAQLAVARPAEPEPGDEADEEEYELEVEESIEDGVGTDYDEEVARRGRRGSVVARSAAIAQHRPSMLARLVGFLQGSWRELQRVQWPDRRQVMQATGVVIGFVIVAAAFLGLADLVAGKLVTFILK
jgi:preprotein translocase subunit SecE